MPSALETLVKILKLERDQGCKDSAVIGGLAAFSDNWMKNAHAQARKPEHHLLVEEVGDLLKHYGDVAGRAERTQRLTYLLDRIMGRVPPPPDWLARLGEMPQAPPPQERPEPKLPPPPRQEAKAPPEPDETGERPASAERRPKGKRGTATLEQLPPRREREPRREQIPVEDAPPIPSAEGGAEMGAEEQTAPARNEGENQQRRERPRKKERPPQSEQQQQQRPPRQQQQQRPQGGGRQTDDGDGDDAPERDSLGYDSYDVITPRRSKTGKGGGPELDIAPMPRLARPPRTRRPRRNAEEEMDLLTGLQKPVTVIRGVGGGTAELLANLGIHTVYDLLRHFPRRYDDYTRLRSIAQLVPNDPAPTTVIGTVYHAEVRAGKGGRKDFFMVLDDGTARMGITFFGQHFLIRTLKRGQQVVMSGFVSAYNGRVTMNNPEWELLDVENLHTTGIVPSYRLTEGMSARVLRKTIKGAVDYWSERMPDPVPEATLERCELADLGWSIRQIHFPDGDDHRYFAEQRLAFDELLIRQLAVLQYRREWQGVPGQSLTVDDAALEAFMSAVFPYTLTGAQQRAIADIRQDAAQAIPMNRLLQGDVGSGKTAVAVVAMFLAVANGAQAAIMVPTGILAEQHYRSISAAFERMPSERKPVVALLTGSLSDTERESIYRGLADGSIDIAIGTHALIQEGVEFNNLALVVVDEQHRFGVEQRKALRGKGTNPHLLVMTATPIPRTLALTMYADLDLSIINEFPPGRIPIRTRVVQPVARERVYEFIEEEVKKGRQAFVVHPLVEESETIDAPSAVEAYERLKQIFHRYRVGLLHGKMRPAEKDEIMAAFSAGEIDVLATTSVAEVGVNVPNATVMVIEGANRFGLAQLHQFRGRVGRGEHASFCLLLSDTTDETAQERLRAMERTTDGFELAEMDWRIRGAGDLMGTRQSGGMGIPRTLTHQIIPALVELSQRESRTIYEEDPALTAPQHQLLAERVRMIQDERTDVS